MRRCGGLSSGRFASRKPYAAKWDCCCETPDDKLMTTARAWLAEDPIRSPPPSCAVCWRRWRQATPRPRRHSPIRSTAPGVRHRRSARPVGTGQQPHEPGGRCQGRGRSCRLPQAAGATSVVIGYDARRNSDVFAHDSARIMAGAGIKVTYISGPFRRRCSHSRSDRWLPMPASWSRRRTRPTTMATRFTSGTAVR